MADDNNDASDVFLHDLHTSKISLVSRSASGGAANGASSRPAISANGQYVAFESDAANLVCSERCSPPDLDINLLVDVFVFNRLEWSHHAAQQGSASPVGWSRAGPPPLTEPGTSSRFRHGAPQTIAINAMTSTYSCTAGANERVALTNPCSSTKSL